MIRPRVVLGWSWLLAREGDGDELMYKCEMYRQDFAELVGDCDSESKVQYARSRCFFATAKASMEARSWGSNVSRLCF